MTTAKKIREPLQKTRQRLYSYNHNPYYEDRCQPAVGSTLIPYSQGRDRLSQHIYERMYIHTAKELFSEKESRRDFWRNLFEDVSHDEREVDAAYFSITCLESCISRSLIEYTAKVTFFGGRRKIK